MTFVYEKKRPRYITSHTGNSDSYTQQERNK